MKTLDFGRLQLGLEKTTCVMGILNVTPDSFSDGGSYDGIEEAVKRAKEMVEEGATIIDIGGESSRPGAEFVDEEKELERVLPVIKRLSKEVDVIISIDTYKASVAKAAIEAGAHIINDITGFKGDSNMAQIAAKLDVPCILMHMRGTPKNMQKKIEYKDVVEDVIAELNESIEIALEAGVKDDNIILDPGIGFAKAFEHNLKLLKGIKKIEAMGYPLLVGASRKRFIGDILEVTVDERVEGSLAVAVMCAWEDVAILRVHDVLETSRALKVVDAIKRV